MKITVNGTEVEVGASATLADAIEGQPYRPGTLIALIRSGESVIRETQEFEIVTSKGPLGLRLNESKFAALFRELVPEIKGRRIRWQTSKVTAIGSFPTQIEVSRDPVHYQKYDCFFALGGFDSRSSYIMIARLNHDGVYGTSGAVLGKITKGRHILSELQEAESILDILPVVEEVRARDAVVTVDMGRKLEEGMSLETFVGVGLEKGSPTSSEHLLVVAEKGTLPITEVSESYAACSASMDVSLVPETPTVRERGVVTVRHEGAGAGRIYIYKVRRQISDSHTKVGIVTTGSELVRLAPAGSQLTVVTDPRRVMVIGMTQAEGARELSGLGLRQLRTGDTADDAIIVEQEPELTLEALHMPEIETLGVRPEKVNDITIVEGKAVNTARYLRKMTGLDHKPIGTLKVHFTFEDMPMVTFDGNFSEAGHLIPENPFAGTVARGEIGVTNMSRPNRGLIGVRLQPGEEFGPTGEEPYGTNMAGKVVSDIDALMRDLKDGDIVYVREVPEAVAPAKKASKRTAKKAKAKEGGGDPAKEPSKPKAYKPQNRKTKEEESIG